MITDEKHLFKESSVKAEVFESWRSALVEAEEGEQRSTESWHFTIWVCCRLEYIRNVLEETFLNYTAVYDFRISKLTSIGDSFLALSLSVSNSPLRRWTGSIRSPNDRISTMFSPTSTVTYCGQNGPSIIQMQEDWWWNSQSGLDIAITRCFMQEIQLSSTWPKSHVGMAAGSYNEKDE